MDHNKYDDGFTLVELLITLLIISLLIFIPVLSIDKVIDTVQVDLFFRELSSNITLMQNHSILTGERTTVEFYPGEKIIKFRVYDESKSLEHPLNNEMFLKEGLYELLGNRYERVTFHGTTGNITIYNHGWRFNFITSQGAYELVFQLGSGRFDIRKK